MLLFASGAKDRLGRTTTQRQRGAGLVDVTAEVVGDVRDSHQNVHGNNCRHEATR